LSGLYEVWDIKELSLLTGGYYAVDFDEKLTIVSLNTLAFSKENVFARDCSHKNSIGSVHLKWLSVQLKRLESKQRKALIVGHIPARREFYHPACLDEYNRLLYRHRRLLIAQLFGHSHEDELFVSKHRGIPAVPALIAPSLSPVFNPAFRILDLEREMISGIKQFYAPSSSSFAHFQLEYDTKEAFSTPTVDIKFILNLEQEKEKKCCTARVRQLSRYRNVCY
jgi:hypothetical protein